MAVQSSATYSTFEHGEVLVLSDAQRRRVLSNFKTYLPAGLLSMKRDLPKEEVILVDQSLYAAFSLEPSPWHDLYVDELARLFSLAETALDPDPYLREMAPFSALGHDEDGPLQQRIRHLLLEKLKSKDDRIRYAALNLLKPFVLRNQTEVVIALDPLRFDSIRKIRVATIELLHILLGEPGPLEGPYLLDSIYLRMKEWFDEL